PNENARRLPLYSLTMNPELLRHAGMPASDSTSRHARWTTFSLAPILHPPLLRRRDIEFVVRHLRGVVHWGASGNSRTRRSSGHSDMSPPFLSRRRTTRPFRLVHPVGLPNRVPSGHSRS